MDEALKLIETFEPGRIFFHKDFRNIEDKQRLRNNLMILVENHTINKLLSGIYEKPLNEEDHGELNTEERVDNFAYAVANQNTWYIGPKGDFALDRIGIFGKYPHEYTYVSSGPYKEYNINGVNISFTNTACKNVSHLSDITILIIQVIRALGKENITDEVIMKLKKYLSAKEKATVLKESLGITYWVYAVIKDVAR